MSSWLTLDLGDALLASPALQQIEQDVVREFNSMGKPVDMAVFIRHDSSASMHCVVRLYFSPAAAALARRLGAVPCDRPSVDDLGLLAGAEQAWGLLSAAPPR